MDQKSLASFCGWEAQITQCLVVADQHFNEVGETGASVHIGTGCSSQCDKPCIRSLRISLSPASLTIGAVMRRFVMQVSRFLSFASGGVNLRKVAGTRIQFVNKSHSAIPSKLFGLCSAISGRRLIMPSMSEAEDR